MAGRDDQRAWKDARDAILFLAGLLGIVHQTVLAHPPEPTLLLVFAAMMGLPAFLKKE